MYISFFSQENFFTLSSNFSATYVYTYAVGKVCDLIIDLKKITNSFEYMRDYLYT